MAARRRTAFDSERGPRSPSPNAPGPARSGSPPSLPPASSCAPADPGGRARRRGRLASAPGGTRSRRASCRTDSRQPAGRSGSSVLRLGREALGQSGHREHPGAGLVGACVAEPKGEAGAEGRQREAGAPPAVAVDSIAALHGAHLRASDPLFGASSSGGRRSARGACRRMGRTTARQHHPDASRRLPVSPRAGRSRARSVDSAAVARSAANRERFTRSGRTRASRERVRASNPRFRRVVSVDPWISARLLRD